jgi:hypothetical protein
MDDNLKQLNDRVRTKLKDMQSLPVVVRRHNLRQAINNERVQQESVSRNIPITYCVADLWNVKRLKVHEVYHARLGDKGVRGDAVLPLLPGTPLMITRNIDRPLGTSSSPLPILTFADLFTVYWPR